MYAHKVISWHRDEEISLEEALNFGVEFATNWFDGFPTLIAVYQDRGHIHVHLVTNTVSDEEGKKVRDKNLSKTFNLNITKEGLLNEFERQSKVRIRRESDDELERYCREEEAIIGGDYGVAEEKEGEQCELEKGKTEVTGADSEVGGREEGSPRRSRRMAKGVFGDDGHGIACGGLCCDGARILDMVDEGVCILIDNFKIKNTYTK